MRATANVNLDGVTPQIFFALGVANSMHRRMFGPPLTITSAKDGTHSPGSLHPKGDAVDLRIHDLPPVTAAAFCASLLDALHPLGYDVVLEPTHIHLEWDPRPGSPPWVERVP